MNSTPGFGWLRLLDWTEGGSELSVWDEVIKFKWTPACTVCGFLDSANYAAVLATVVPMNNFLWCCYQGWAGGGLVLSNIVLRHDPPVKHFILGQHRVKTTPTIPLTLLYIPEIKILNIRYLFYIGLQADNVGRRTAHSHAVQVTQNRLDVPRFISEVNQQNLLLKIQAHFWCLTVWFSV